MFRNRSVDTHQFAMIPRAEIPRSQFRMQTTHKTTFDAGWLVPIYLDEILPGDTFTLKMTAFARLATPIFPIMDNLYLESFFFFVPTRILWTNFVKFMGEQDNPGDSISYTVPTMTSPAGGYPVNSLFDYMGLPTVGQVGAGNTVTHSALPLRAYATIWNQWFRDENLQSGFTVSKGDGPDSSAAVNLSKRGKRHDYFTSCLPFLQKGTAVPLPLTGNAIVKTSNSELVTSGPAPMYFRGTAGANGPLSKALGTGAAFGVGGSAQLTDSTTANTVGAVGGLIPSNLYADLSTVTQTTINALRLSFQTQKLLERDARGGTRYTEIVRSHFGVISPDARLQRPEYLGGGTTPINISPVAQTSNTPVTGTPQGNLSAFGTALAQGHGFRQSFTEHGYIVGLVSVRADLTYQQGLRRLWSRSTRYDFYFPVFAALGEQAVLNREIYCDGSATDAQVFGYQERWGEYRYHPSRITGLFRSTSAGTLDPWHLAQRFTGVPVLDATFIQETPPMDRILAVPSQPDFIFDSFFDIVAARPMPMYSVPGLIDHF